MTTATVTPPAEPAVTTTTQSAPSTPSLDPVIPATTPLATAAQSSDAPATDGKVVEPAAPAAPAATEPEEYELEIEADSPLTEKELGEIAEEAGRLGLTKDDAMKLVATRESDYKRGLSSAEVAFKAKYEAAAAEIAAAPEFSGAAKEESFRSIALAVKSFGDPDLVAALNTPEVGNNLALARFLKKIGDQLKPDSIHGKGTFMPKDDAKDDPLKRAYPDFFEKK